MLIFLNKVQNKCFFIILKYFQMDNCKIISNFINLMVKILQNHFFKSLLMTLYSKFTNFTLKKNVSWL